MENLKKYVEWIAVRRTGRIAYAVSVFDLPRVLPCAERQLNLKFDASADLEFDPSLQDIFDVAIEKDPSRQRL
jgi:hypothetical protein